MRTSPLYTALTWLYCILLAAFTYLSLQTFLTEEYGVAINRVLGVMVAIGGLLAVSDPKGVTRSGFTRAMILWSAWMAFSALFVHGSLPMLIKMLFWQSAFYGTYMLLKDAPGRIRIFQLFFAGLAVLVSLYTYWAREISEMTQALAEMGHMTNDFYEAALNIVFYPLLTIPWILTMKKGWVRNLLLLVLLLSIIISVKRSALIASAVIVAAYMLFYSRFTMQSHKRLRRILVPVLLAGTVFYIIQRYLSDTGEFIVERIENIQEDKGSGRLRIYEQVLDRLSYNQPDEWIFGHGHNTVIANIPMHKSAHNDFLEVLFDYGLIGLALYLALHMLLIARVYRLYKNSSQYFVSYLASYIIFLTMSLVSHLIIYPTYFVFLGAYWGAMEALMVGDHIRKDASSRLLAPYTEESGVRYLSKNRNA